jgi:hypothetical protein
MIFNTICELSMSKVVIRKNKRFEEEIIHCIHIFNKSFFKRRPPWTKDDIADYNNTVEYFEQLENLRWMNT